MATVTINYIAVLVSAVIGMVIGALWYSPFLFGKVWMKLMNFDKKKLEEAKKKGMGKTYFIAFIGVLVMAYVLARILAMTQMYQMHFGGVQLGFWIWLGFIAPVQLGTVLWENKPLKLFLLNTSHNLVVLIVMGTILAVWS